MLVLQPHAGAVYVNVTVQAAPGQPDNVPHTIVLPRSVLLTMMSTPAPPLEHVSVPRRSLAPRIFDVIVWPGRTS
jgi:hypothetical protein